MNEVNNLLDALAERITPERRDAVNAVLALELTGQHGGTWTIDARKESQLGLLEGAPTAHGLEARTTATMSAEDFVRLVKGELKAPLAVMMGRLKLRGDMGLAMRIAQLF